MHQFSADSSKRFAWEEWDLISNSQSHYYYYYYIIIIIIID